MKTLLLAGFDHVNYPVETLEKTHVPSGGLADFYALLPFEEKVWLQTCNRRELAVLSGPDGREKLADFFKMRFKAGVQPYFYSGEEAVRRLFRITAGLLSAMPGEMQVLGQVRDAHKKALELKACKSALSRVFCDAISAGRLARNRTGISKGAVSLGQAAIMFAETCGGIAGKNILLIGAGKINESAARYAGKKGASLILLANRTFEKAAALAAKTGAKAVRFDCLHECLSSADIVISATSAPHFVLKKENAGKILAQRDKPVLIIDLAVPRDIDPGLAGGMTRLIGLDEVKKTVNDSICSRINCIAAAEDIIEKEVKKHEDRFRRKEKQAVHGAGARGNEAAAGSFAGAHI